MWFDIEGPQYWSGSSSANINFLAVRDLVRGVAIYLAIVCAPRSLPAHLQAMINQANARGQHVGIYSSASQARACLRRRLYLCNPVPAVEPDHGRFLLRIRVPHLVRLRRRVSWCACFREADDDVVEPIASQVPPLRWQPVVLGLGQLRWLGAFDALRAT